MWLFSGRNAEHWFSEVVSMYGLNICLFRNYPVKLYTISIIRNPDIFDISDNFGISGNFSAFFLHCRGWQYFPKPTTPTFFADTNSAGIVKAFARNTRIIENVLILDMYVHNWSYSQMVLSKTIFYPGWEPFRQRSNPSRPLSFYPSFIQGTSLAARAAMVAGAAMAAGATRAAGAKVLVHVPPSFIFLSGLEAKVKVWPSGPSSLSGHSGLSGPLAALAAKEVLWICMFYPYPLSFFYENRRIVLLAFRFLD